MFYEYVLTDVFTSTLWLMFKSVNRVDKVWDKSKNKIGHKTEPTLSRCYPFY